MGSSCFGDRVQGEVNAFERSALSKSGCFYHLCRSFLTNPVQKHSSCLSHRSLERGVILFRRQSAWEGNAFERSALSKSGCFYHLCRSFLTNPVQKHALCLSLSLSLSLSIAAIFSVVLSSVLLEATVHGDEVVVKMRTSTI